MKMLTHGLARKTLRYLWTEPLASLLTQSADHTDTDQDRLPGRVCASQTRIKFI